MTRNYTSTIYNAALRSQPMRSDMAGVPNSRNWMAVELPDFIGRHYRIFVTGDVEVTATNLFPKLSYHRPQGFNPRIPLLDLTIESSGGFGGQIVFYRSAFYIRATSGVQYDEVDILFR